jgi:hypothetical protein
MRSSSKTPLPKQLAFDFDLPPQPSAKPGRSVMRRTRLTPGSTSFGSPVPSTQPTVVSRPRHSDRSYVAPVAGAVAAPWLHSWFHARVTSRLSDPFETLARSARRRVRHGNNCWRCLPVFFVCV